LLNEWDTAFPFLGIGGARDRLAPEAVPQDIDAQKGGTMKQMLTSVGLVMIALLVLAMPALAVDQGAHQFYGNAVGAGFGTAMVLVGAGWGFGRIGQAALESMARQPEIAPRIQTGMLIIAALLEGATFFALIVCIIMAVKA
jgi:F-type H+-transporting ATPase subunit c